jgi:hypothetical protein
MSGENADLVLRVAANLTALQADMAQVTTILGGVTTTTKAASVSASDFARTATQAGAAQAHWTDQLRAFDGVLASAGVHIGPEIRALGELGTASGKTASSLGLVATAGLAMGVGMAAWGITRAAMDFFQLDGAVQKTWESLLNLGTAEETFNAKMDILQLATFRAKRQITDMSEALQINKTWMEDWNLSHHKSADALGDSAALVAKWRIEIDRVKTEGNFAAMTADINSQNLSVAQLSVKYGIHVEALNFLARSTKEAEARIKELDETILATWKAEAEAAKIMEDVEIKLHKGYLDRFKAEAEATLKLTGEKNQVVIEGLTQIQQAQAAQADYTAKLTLTSSDYQIREIWRVVAEEERAFKGSEEQRAQYNQVVEALAQQQADVLIAKARQTEADLLTITVGHGPDAPNAGAGRVGAGGFAGTAIPADILASTAGMMAGVGRDMEVARQMAMRMPHMDAGGPVLRDGPIYAHAGETVVPKGGGGASGGGGPTIIQLHLDGKIVAQVVHDHHTKSMKQSRQWPSA